MDLRYTEKINKVFKWTDLNGYEIEVFVDNFEVFKQCRSNDDIIFKIKKVKNNGYVIHVNFSKAIINGIEMIDSGDRSMKGYMLLLDEKENGLYLRVISEFEKYLPIEDENKLERQGVSYKFPKNFEIWHKEQLEKGAKEIQKKIEIAFNDFSFKDEIVNVTIFKSMTDEKLISYMETNNESVTYHSDFVCIKKEFDNIIRKEGLSILDSFLTGKETIISNKLETFNYNISFSNIKKFVENNL